MKIEEKINKYLAEGKNDYIVYHPSYTSAVNEALKFAEKQGYTTDPNETFDLIGSGPRKPTPGKTNSLHIPLYKNGKEQRKALHFQVYNRGISGNTFELNAYIS